MRPIMTMYKILRPEAFKDFVSYVIANSGRQLKSESDLFNIPPQEAAALIDGWFVKQFGGNDSLYKTARMAGVVRQTGDGLQTLKAAQSLRDKVGRQRPAEESLEGFIKTELRSRMRDREYQIGSGGAARRPIDVSKLTVAKARELERQGINGNILAVSALFSALSKPLTEDDLRQEET